MVIMPWRYTELEAAVAGFERCGVPLVGFAGNEFVAAGYSDAKGIYYAIPWMVRTFGVSLDRAIDLFFYGLLVAGFAVGLAGLMVLFRSRRQRLIALVQWAVLAAFALRFIHDLYVVGIAATVAIVPWALVVLNREHARWRAAGVCAGAGLILGAAHQFRGHATTGTAVLILLLIWMRSQSPLARRGLLTAVLCGAALLPHAWFGALEGRRDAFLVQHNPEYFARCSTAFDGAPWHSIYIGFGYLKNPHVPAYLDEVAIERVESIDPDAVYCTEQYSSILRNETLQLAGRQKLLVIETLSAKAGVLAFWVLLFGNAGLLLALYRGGWTRRDAAFGAAALFAAAPGLLVMPLPHYVSSLLGLAMVYGTIRLNTAIAQRPSAGLTLSRPDTQPISTEAA